MRLDMMVAAVLLFQAGDHVRWAPKSFYGHCVGVVHAQWKNEYRVEVKCVPDINRMEWFKGTELTHDNEDFYR